MTTPQDSAKRTDRLIAQWIDGTLSTEEIVELNRLLKCDDHRLEQVADQLILDALLVEELGPESLTALVDFVGNTSGNSAFAAEEVQASSSEPRTRPRSHWRTYLGWTLVAASVITMGFFVGRWEISSPAHAAAIVRTAIQRHAEPIERVYVVQVERDPSITAEVISPREIRVITQGEQFYVEAARGERRWAWGRDRDGSHWMALGSRMGVRIAEHEMGPRLQRMSDLYSLNLNSLLEDVLRSCRLDHSTQEGTYTIKATPERRPRRGLQQATIELDQETKAVRRLVMERRSRRQGATQVIFTLIETRPVDESKYHLAGHLEDPYRILAGDQMPFRRRQVLRNWFGETADQWIQTNEGIPDAK
jgi:hypothetical protein